jgi:hypothetical protein
VIDGNYRIVYRATADEVQILAVVLGARLFPIEDAPPSGSR